MSFEIQLLRLVGLEWGLWIRDCLGPLLNWNLDIWCLMLILIVQACTINRSWNVWLYYSNPKFLCLHKAITSWIFLYFLNQCIDWSTCNDGPSLEHIYYKRYNDACHIFFTSHIFYIIQFFHLAGFLFMFLVPKL